MKIAQFLFSFKHARVIHSLTLYLQLLNHEQMDKYWKVRSSDGTIIRDNQYQTDTDKN